MKKKRIRNITIGVVIILAIAGISIFTVINGRFRYNKEGDVGNTTGNIYNGGLFCEYKGYVYFANPADDNSLYRIKDDGTDLKKLHTDSVSYIQVVNDYIYYVRLNRTSADVVLRGQPYGIFRLEIGDDKAEKVYSGLVKSMCLCGNYIYFQAYDDKNLIQLKRIKVDGEELKLLSDKDYQPLAVWKNDIYFPEIEGGYYLKRLEVGNDRIATAYEGNFYMPAFVEGYMYYIDLDKNMKLSRISFATDKSEIIEEERCINYNISADGKTIYYQLESKNGHKLCRMNADGTNKVIIAEGDFCNIHITKNYTYFYRLVGADEKILYRVKNSGNTIQEVNFRIQD